jgi:very-short-patch-repair endonuclease
MKGALGYKIRTIVCAGCGLSVTRRFRPAARYCSQSCSRSSPKPARRTGKTFACEQCGKDAYKPVNQSAYTHHFCGLACANIWQGRNKTSHACIICGVTFLWSPSRHKAYNINYCSVECRSKDPRWREQLLRMNTMQQEGRQTEPERIGYALLGELRIDHLPQHTIGGKFCVDAFCPALALVVQFDGDYWHGHPDKFPSPDARQQRRMKLDRSQDAYMAVCGYQVLRLWEHDLKHNLDSVRQRLRPFATLQARMHTEQA